ncbi:MAG: hypothetical protein H5T97_08840 [Firmicutes bacterium]|nr:hypothetical protein [Bacillota bacterium]
MRSKLAILIAVLSLAAFCMAGAAWASPEDGRVTVLVDGKVVESDVPAYLHPAGRTMVPLRWVAQAFGCRVEWAGFDAELPVQVWVPAEPVGEIGVFGFRPGKNTLVFWPRKTREPGRKELAGYLELGRSAGREFYTDVAPEIRDGRTFVPIRVLSEAMGCRVDWDPATYTVSISRPDLKKLIALNPWLDAVWDADLAVGGVALARNYAWLIENVAPGPAEAVVLVAVRGMRPNQATDRIPRVLVKVYVDGREAGEGYADAVPGMDTLRGMFYSEALASSCARVPLDLEPGEHRIRAEIVSECLFDRSPAYNSKEITVTVAAKS